MPTGPQGQKRPADAIGCAVLVAQIATGEVQDMTTCDRSKGGITGAKAERASYSKWSDQNDKRESTVQVR
jgi:hypothetical protein